MGNIRDLSEVNTSSMTGFYHACWCDESSKTSDFFEKNLFQSAQQTSRIYRVAPKQGHYGWLHAHIFKTHETVCMILGTLQCCLVLDASVNSVFIKFITVVPTGESQQAGFRFQRLLWEFQLKMWSRTGMERLLNKLTAAVMERWEDRSRKRSVRTTANIVLVGDSICS